jgi:DNA-binding transcriptional MerR regulator
MNKQHLVSEVHKVLGISRKTLYLWEQAGKIPQAKRDPMSRYRVWDHKELEKLKKITGRG